MLFSQSETETRNSMVRLFPGKRDGRGMTLAEVMIALAIFGLAILPTMGIFDTGLRGTKKQIDFAMALEIAEQEMDRYLNSNWNRIISFDKDNPSPHFQWQITQGPITYELALEVTLMDPAAAPLLLTYYDESSGAPSLEALAIDNCLKKLHLTVSWNDTIGKRRTFELSTLKARIVSD
ncbi:MAG: hypothetical protein CVV64_08955 [Candidatus Wallbacteria bacterium HGW-Wallbacteria-1]|jgi:prepilin-type N-terminal cleavage/methylation domain-containing protein|uniref:Prepilin-type N-terminal cleavage/methylation domain-containing protein n=1 Tax=Candidatus Wallbacteria bacterium HGW-Wallbacteria-1 TaxID=2013854 RepID=A0A2N1PQC2_9BACT|nr:MAG: hypothetical protein CVV64_08955 [Candidatus Wallbacteria bacterium HGW-Wallbacteria-1]